MRLTVGGILLPLYLNVKEPDVEYAGRSICVELKIRLGS